MRRIITALLLGLTALLFVAACGDDDDRAATTGNNPDVNADDETTDVADDIGDLAGDPDGDDLDPESIDPCVFTPEEMQTLRQLNADVVGGFGTVGPGTVNRGGLNRCEYELRFEEDPDNPSTTSVVALSAERETVCFVLHRGVCLAPGTTFGDERPTSYEVPDEIVAAAIARLDAM